MNITILTYGSRGDVQPFLPLSVGLIKRGHIVKLAAPSRFKSLVGENGIPFVPLAGEPETLSRALNDAGANPFKMIREFMRHAVEIGADVLRQTEESCKDADLVIHTFAHAVGAHTLAREMNIPDVHIQTFPMFTPTGDYSSVTMPDFRFRALNRSTHLFAKRISWWSACIGFEQVRRRMGLPKRKLYSPFDGNPLRPPTPVLCAWSPGILPPSTDWDGNVYVTGYFFFDAVRSYQPPADLEAFLDSGTPPVCVSFGSMVNRDAAKIDRIVREALLRTGQRGLILSGWGRVHGPASSDFLYLDSVPHDWLLPRCKMIVHHGGAGTTSAGLQAGIPNVIVAFTADQPFWGRRVHAVGAGPAPIRVNALSKENLSLAMVEAASEAVRKRAQDIGQKVRSEDGVARAMALIESHSSTWRNFKV